MNDVALGILQAQLCFHSRVRSTATQQVFQEEHGIFPEDEDAKWHANHMVTGQSKKLHGRKIDFSNSARTIETDVARRRKIVEVLISLNGMLELDRIKKRLRALGLTRAVWLLSAC